MTPTESQLALEAYFYDCKRRMPDPNNPDDEAIKAAFLSGWAARDHLVKEYTPGGPNWYYFFHYRSNKADA